MQTTIEPKRFCGRDFTAQELLLIQEVVGTCGGLSRRELAHTVCELLDWKRPGGGLKFRECQDLLELLEASEALSLPAKRRTGYNGPQTCIEQVPCKEPYSTLSGSVEFFTPWMCSGSRAESNGPFSGILSAGTTTWDMRCLSGQGFSIWYM